MWQSFLTCQASLQFPLHPCQPRALLWHRPKQLLSAHMYKSYSRQYRCPRNPAPHSQPRTWPRYWNLPLNPYKWSGQHHSRRIVLKKLWAPLLNFSSTPPPHSRNPKVLVSSLTSLSEGWQSLLLYLQTGPNTYTSTRQSVRPYCTTTTTQPIPSQPSATSVNPPPLGFRTDYDKDTDCRPCPQWTWGWECGFSASRGILPACFLHNCA